MLNKQAMRVYTPLILHHWDSDKHQGEAGCGAASLFVSRQNSRPPPPPAACLIFAAALTVPRKAIWASTIINMAMHSITAPLSSDTERELHARNSSCRAAATDGENEMVNQSIAVHVAKEEESTQAETRGMEPKICTGDGGDGERRLLPLELVLVFPEKEGMMQQSSVSISLSF